MTPSSRPARSVLVEHGSRHTRIVPGDEVFLALPGGRAHRATSCTVTAPSGKAVNVTPRLRDHGGGAVDACVETTTEKVGRWRYSWRVGGKRISGVFFVSHPVRKRRGKARS